MKKKQTKVSLPQMKDRLSERLHLGLPMAHFRTWGQIKRIITYSTIILFFKIIDQEIFKVKERHVQDLKKMLLLMVLLRH